MRPFACIILSVGLIFSIPVYSQESETQTLTLDEFVTRACREDTVFREILSAGYALQYREALLLDPEDLILSIEHEHAFRLKSDDTGVTTSIGLERLFRGSGTEVALDYRSTPNTARTADSSEIALTITQPLAENAFGSVARLREKIIGLENDISRFQIVEAYEDYLAALIRAYYDWYEAYENVRTARNAYEQSLTLLENIEARRSSNIALAIDVNKVKLQALEKREILLTTESVYAARIGEIARAVRMDDPERLSPVLPPVYADIDKPFEQSYASFISASRTQRVLALLEKTAQGVSERYARELLPSIALTAGLTHSGDGRDLSGSEQAVRAGINIEWPVPGKQERARYETARIDAERTRLNTLNVQAGLKRDLATIYAQIVTARDQLAIADERIALAEAILRDEQVNYSYGKVSLNDLIKVVDDLEDQKFSRIDHAVRLRALTVEWLRLTDTLVTADSPDGL